VVADQSFWQMRPCSYCRFTDKAVGGNDPGNNKKATGKRLGWAGRIAFAADAGIPDTPSAARPRLRCKWPQRGQEAIPQRVAG
jgi:hypothetical protein